MNANALFSVGHSSRTIEEFVAMMTENGISAIADVRSQPHSHRYPHFNAEPLKRELRKAGIDYVFLGDQLGARRREPECYEEGQAKYESIESVAGCSHVASHSCVRRRTHCAAIA